MSKFTVFLAQPSAVKKGLKAKGLTKVEAIHGPATLDFVENRGEEDRDCTLMQDKANVGKVIAAAGLFLPDGAMLLLANAKIDGFWVSYSTPSKSG